MAEESAAYLDFAHEVLDATGNDTVRAAIDAVGLYSDLRLSSVVARYFRVSEALSAALDVPIDAGLKPLITAGEQLLRLRVTNEQAVTGASEYAGR